MWRVELLRGAMFLLLIYDVKAFEHRKRWKRSRAWVKTSTRRRCFERVCLSTAKIIIKQPHRVLLFFFLQRGPGVWLLWRDGIKGSPQSPSLCFFITRVSSPHDVACHTLLGGPELRRKSSGLSRVAAQQFGHCSPSRAQTPPTPYNPLRGGKKDPIRLLEWGTHSVFPQFWKRTRKCMLVFVSFWYIEYQNKRYNKIK